jgi:hypothetical protein
MPFWFGRERFVVTRDLITRPAVSHSCSGYLAAGRTRARAWPADQTALRSNRPARAGLLCPDDFLELLSQGLTAVSVPVYDSPAAFPRPMIAR